MDDFDELLRELGAIDEQLLDLPTDAYEQRVTLHARQNELRSQLHAVVPDYDATRPTAEIEAELASLESQLEAVMSSEINIAAQSDDDGGVDATKIDAAIETGHGAQQLRQRIAHLQNVLARRDAASQH